MKGSSWQKAGASGLAVKDITVRKQAFTTQPLMTDSQQERSSAIN